MDIIRSQCTQSVSAYYQRGPYRFQNATASVSLTADHWWIDRVFVSPGLRGKGVGKTLLLDVIERAREHTPGMKFVVCPSGYNMKYSDQKAFYESCGFVETEPGMMERT